jgi:hypothetical protein
MGTKPSGEPRSAEEQGRRLAEEVSTDKSRDPAREGKREVDGTAEEKGRQLAKEVPSGLGGLRGGAKKTDR